MLSIRKIVLATDFRETSQKAHEMAALLREQLACTLDVVHVYDPHTFQLPAPYNVLSGAGSWLDDHLERVRVQVRDALTHLPESLGPCETHLLEGRPGAAIVSFATRHQADMIVLGTHGYKGWDRLMLGSVAEFVTRHAHCAVLTIKPSVD